ncbi:hypothetical protein JH06_2144 [Blastocystis sp. subtype 4]|uniref:hypothetical protein n=1 Tax=Blastocystis sp. subtype 4 TaxID=944170 RepID=UPI000711FC19|nr:hypothetical protein JH06_2144 [Blastocystis sp. subtype 4]KNB44914.1 hypothetical protein JH06_2144 [Blastocystis sp. subtype 4]|eukprot:XP_014528357.1 hypothetical protein JH06_2144 [Blastocystis sp. subtype 4]
MESEEDAKKCVDGMNKGFIDGDSLSLPVRAAAPKKPLLRRKSPERRRSSSLSSSRSRSRSRSSRSRSRRSHSRSRSSRSYSSYSRSYSPSRSYSRSRSYSGSRSYSPSLDRVVLVPIQTPIVEEDRLFVSAIMSHQQTE